MVDNISRASSEQALSIAQVTQGIDQISSVVQTNSATAEESAAASEELSGQAFKQEPLSNFGQRLLLFVMYIQVIIIAPDLDSAKQLKYVLQNDIIRVY